MTLLVNKMAAAKAAGAAKDPPSLLSRMRLDTPRGELVAMPMLGQVWVELAGEMVTDEIEGATFKAMRDLGLDAIALNGESYGGRRLALTLQWAVREPDQGRRHVNAGTTEEWLAMDLELLAACGRVYTDVRERLNPLSTPISADELERIRHYHEKKNTRGLRSFGVDSLASYIASMGVPPVSSPMMPSSDGASSPDEFSP